jgi:hypothetical protein
MMNPITYVIPKLALLCSGTRLGNRKYIPFLSLPEMPVEQASTGFSKRVRRNLNFSRRNVDGWLWWLGSVEVDVETKETVERLKWISQARLPLHSLESGGSDVIA